MKARTSVVIAALFAAALAPHRASAMCAINLHQAEVAFMLNGLIDRIESLVAIHEINGYEIRLKHLRNDGSMVDVFNGYAANRADARRRVTEEVAGYLERQGMPADVALLTAGKLHSLENDRAKQSFRADLSTGARVEVQGHHEASRDVVGNAIYTRRLVDARNMSTVWEFAGLNTRENVAHFDGFGRFQEFIGGELVGLMAAREALREAANRMTQCRSECHAWGRDGFACTMAGLAETIVK